MANYIVLLRAVNVSGKNLIKMADLKKVLLDHGYNAVQTYIQSGNICLETEEKPETLQSKINKIILKEFNLNIHVFVLNKLDLQQALIANPYHIDLPKNKVFIAFLSDNPQQNEIETLKKADLKNEEYMILDKKFYFYLPDGMATSKLNNALIEKKLKVNATARNLNTLEKLLQITS